MGLFDKKESKREIGKGLDEDEINKVFDALDKRDESKKVNENLKKEMSNIKESSNILEDAQKEEMSGHFDEAIKLYEKILVMNPIDSNAYDGLVRIFDNQNDLNNEIRILKMAIKNLEGNEKSKFAKILKEINNS